MFGFTPDRPFSELANQSVVIKNDNPNESDIYRSNLTPENSPLTSTPLKDGPGYREKNPASTTYELFQVGKTKGNEFIGKRNEKGVYEYITYEQADKKITNFGSALVNYYKFEPKSQNMIGIYLKNSPEWIITDEACAHYSIISVPMYDTFDNDALKYIIEHSELSLVVTSNNLLPKLLNISEHSDILKHIVIIDDEISEENLKIAKERGISMRTLKENEEFGKANPKEHVPPKATDIATICYTSGTTNKPKGVIVTHKNMVATTSAFFHLMPDSLKFKSDEVYFCYLPLAHMFERCITHAMIGFGMKIGFFCGNPRKLINDIQDVKPVVLPTVPRILLRIYDTIQQTLAKSGYIKRLIFNIAYNSKKYMLKKGCISKNTIWDVLVFRKIQNVIGGDVKLMLSAAAPIESKVLEFVRIVFGCNIVEGYGSTETTACGTLTLIGDYQYPFGHHVGVPFPSLELKLVAIPDMDYYPTDENPRGEVCFRGNNVTQGYWKNEYDTNENYKDGWFCTGDIGVILPNGTLKIIDRKKNIFKLQQGEYVAPENIEAKINNQYISQTFVYGSSLCSKLVAIIVPDEEILIPYAKENLGYGEDVTLEMLCKDEKVNTLIMDEMKKMAEKTKLHGFEIPAAIYLSSEAFTIENGLLTPTFKTKRNKAYSRYKNQIDDLYKKIGQYKG